VCTTCGPASPHVASRNSGTRAAVTQKPRLQHTPQWGPVDVRTRGPHKEQQPGPDPAWVGVCYDGIQQAVVPQDTPCGIAACGQS
ncbi:unnamed protein product, partial [Ixodes persulcatus]